MTRPLVVEREAVGARPDLDDAAIVRRVRQRRRDQALAHDVGAAICRPRRLRAEPVLDVGEDQLLMLLLVLEAELDDARVGTILDDRVQHAAIDLGAIRVHVGQRRPRYQAATFAPRARAGRLVVAVEQERVLGGDRRDAEWREHERLEEPRRVREVPLRGARIGHRLQLRVFRRQRCAQAHRARTHAFEAIGERHRHVGGP